jgi:hypothetical protein
MTRQGLRNYGRQFCPGFLMVRHDCRPCTFLLTRHQYRFALPCVSPPIACSLPMCVVEPERLVRVWAAYGGECVDAEAGAVSRMPSIV